MTTRLTAKQIQDIAPPTPPCFKSREDWTGYLVSAQECAKQKPFRGNVFQPTFNFCQDCTLAHSVAMARKSLCNPSFFAVIEFRKSRIEREAA